MRQTITGGLKARAKSLLLRPFKVILRDREIEGIIWEIVNRPTDIQSRRAENIRAHLYKKAARETAEYVEKNMMHVPSLPNRDDLFDLSLSKVRVDGLYLEFGVGRGGSINFLAARVKTIVHGFDSFQGLPEPWIDKAGKGAYSAGGVPPPVRDNVALHIGYFAESLPKFAAEYPGPAAFIHVDCDIYSAAKTVFDYLGERIVPGTIIQFDEYFNYPGWKNHEYKAFQEFIKKRNLKYEYLGYDSCGYSVSVQMA